MPAVCYRPLRNFLFPVLGVLGLGSINYDRLVAFYVIIRDSFDLMAFMFLLCPLGVLSSLRILLPMFLFNFVFRLCLSIFLLVSRCQICWLVYILA